MIGMVAALAVAGGVWWFGGGPQRQGITPVAGGPDCPMPVAQQPPPRDGLADHLVPIMARFPVGPERATVCRYPGMNSRSAGVIRGAALDAARTAEVAGWLNSGPAPTADPDTCTGQDDGSRIVLTFGYPQGPPVQVVIRTSGCPATSNGVRHEVTPREVVTRIAGLVPTS